MEEQYVLELCYGKMWVKFFSLNIFKIMDEDFVEVVDDGDYLRERWLWL